MKIFLARYPCAYLPLANNKDENVHYVDMPKRMIERREREGEREKER